MKSHQTNKISLCLLFATWKSNFTNGLWILPFSPFFSARNQSVIKSMRMKKNNSHIVGVVDIDCLYLNVNQVLGYKILSEVL